MINSRVYATALFAQKFFFPADWDIYVGFEPIENTLAFGNLSPTGKFSIRAGWQNVITMGDKL